MKVTIEVPDELYRQVKAKSALDGRTVREVTEELFRSFVRGQRPAEAAESEPDEARPTLPDEPTPAWFGALKSYARQVNRHDMDSIRKSITRGVAEDHGL